MFLQPLNNRRIQNQKGGSLVEIVVVVGIIAGSLAVILGLAAIFLATSQVVQQTSKAVALAQEGLEIVRNVRDGTDWAVDGLATLTVGSDYYPAESGGQWQFNPGIETVEEFTRKIVFLDVCRDGNDDIATCPASYTDGDTKQAVVTLTWQERGKSHQVELQSYVADWGP